MAAFGKQLSEVDIAAIITYERNAWGNKVGDMVTPKDILTFKQAQE
jgi:cytochrome c oxidase subunit 2